jgi:hypothetical protein
MEPWLSVLGGGLAAALVTIGFSVWWDKQKQKSSEDWEFRRYHANQVHFATVGLVEVFFAAKTEIYFLSCTLETLLAGLNQLTAQADTIVRQQGGPNMSIAELNNERPSCYSRFRTTIPNRLPFGGISSSRKPRNCKLRPKPT